MDSNGSYFERAFPLSPTSPGAPVPHTSAMHHIKRAADKQFRRFIRGATKTAAVSSWIPHNVRPGSSRPPQKTIDCVSSGDNPCSLRLPRLSSFPHKSKECDDSPRRCSTVDAWSQRSHHSPTRSYMPQDKSYHSINPHDLRAGLHPTEQHRSQDRPPVSPFSGQRQFECCRVMGQSSKSNQFQTETLDRSLWSEFNQDKPTLKHPHRQVRPKGRACYVNECEDYRVLLNPFTGLIEGSLPVRSLEQLPITSMSVNSLSRNVMESRMTCRFSDGDELRYAVPQLTEVKRPVDPQGCRLRAVDRFDKLEPWVDRPPYRRIEATSPPTREQGRSTAHTNCRTSVDHETQTDTDNSNVCGIRGLLVDRSTLVQKPASRINGFERRRDVREQYGPHHLQFSPEAARHSTYKSQQHSQPGPTRCLQMGCSPFTAPPHSPPLQQQKNLHHQPQNPAFLCPTASRNYVQAQSRESTSSSERRKKAVPFPHPGAVGTYESEESHDEGPTATTNPSHGRADRLPRFPLPQRPSWQNLNAPYGTPFAKPSALGAVTDIMDSSAATDILWHAASKDPLASWPDDLTLPGDVPGSSDGGYCWVQNLQNIRHVDPVLQLGIAQQRMPPFPPNTSYPMMMNYPPMFYPPQPHYPERMLNYPQGYRTQSRHYNREYEYPSRRHYRGSRRYPRERHNSACLCVD